MTTRHLFPGFLEDAAVYGEAESYWLGTWAQIAAGFEGWTAPWLSNEGADGTPFRDGNPIFSAISSEGQRAIRIIQFESASDSIEVSRWLDTFGGDSPDSPAITELVISLAPSEEALQAARIWMSRWIAGGQLTAQFDPVRLPTHPPETVSVWSSTSFALQAVS